MSSFKKQKGKKKERGQGGLLPERISSSNETATNTTQAEVMPSVLASALPSTLLIAGVNSKTFCANVAQSQICSQGLAI